MTDSGASRTNRLMSVAKEAIASGMKVLAVMPRAKNPDIRFSPNGLNSATGSLKEVKRWLKQDDQINLAASLKDSGICVVDVDGGDGEESLRRLSNIPRTRKTITRNGTHRFYKYEGDLGGSIIKYAPDLDFIISGYVMLPVSRHPDGGLYTSADFSSPIAEMPTKLVNAMWTCNGFVPVTDLIMPPWLRMRAG